MSRIRLVHWNPDAAEAIIGALRDAGSEVDYDARAQDISAAFVIDLSKLPSHGREVAVWLRGEKSTRMIPILFVGGEPEKVSIVREKLPDAARARGWR